ILLRPHLSSQQLVWVNIAAWLREGGGPEVSFDASFSLSTRKPDDPKEKQRRAQRIVGAKTLVKRSGLKLMGSGGVDAFSLMLPDGLVRPSPRVAFCTLVHLALLKLPFWMKRQADVIDGAPYLDPDGMSISKAEVNAAAAELVVDEQEAMIADDDSPRVEQASPFSQVRRDIYTYLQAHGLYFPPRVGHHLPSLPQDQAVRRPLRNQRHGQDQARASSGTLGGI